MTQTAGFDMYGGATVTRATDAAGNVYRAFCAKKLSTGVFGFYITKNGAELPYSPFCTGRGSINGQGTWIAWNNEDFFEGAIPGFVVAPPPVGVVGPKGDKGDIGPQGPKGDPGTGGGLSARYTQALERLCAWLGIP